MKLLLFSLIIILCIFARPLSAQEKNYYFYHPEKNFGSELTFNPLSMMLNGGFDVLRNGKNSKNLWKQPYKTGFENVWRNITNPLSRIEKFGWKRFMTSELFPVSDDAEQMQYFPNYGNHLVGHGMKYVRLSEWYDYHNFSHPKVWAFFTSFSSAYLNEVIENGSNTAVNADPIADMLIFNPLGILLFSTDWAKKFFSSTLPLYDWSLQPVYNPFNGHLENTGEQYVVNLDLSERYGLFFYWGTSGILGLTIHNEDGSNISVGAGAIVNKLIERRLITSKTFARYVAPETIDGALGFFYDRSHSLLTSLIVTGPVYYNARLNIYPGLFYIKNFTCGIFVGAGELDKLQAGITVASIPIGLSLGYN